MPPKGGNMALTDTFVKSVKHTGAPAGGWHTDGGDMRLLVNGAGRYWRMNYRFADGPTTACAPCSSSCMVDACMVTMLTPHSMAMLYAARYTQQPCTIAV
jgi:hypothetical protein